jgi:hypothetical protein
MMIKKMLMLLGAVMALVAFSAPGSAQAEVWSAEGEELLTGTLTNTTGGLNVTCPVRAGVDFWNEPEATAEVTFFEIKYWTCETNVEAVGCEIQRAGPIGLPWHVDVWAGQINITEAGFFNEFTGANCGLVGIPTGVEIPASGNATGSWFSGIQFFMSGDLEGAKGPVTLEGWLISFGGIKLE